MTPRDLALATLVAVIWGVAFLATRIALDVFSPAQLATLRFVIPALPVLLARRPLPWSTLVPIGLTLLAGQFVFQFLGIASGVPPGLAAVVVQTQALFTVVLAAVVLRETPAGRQIFGLALALLGLGLIALTIGGTVAPFGFAFTLVSALAWAAGNVLLKRAGPVDVRALIPWLSLVTVAPCFALSLAVEGPHALVTAVARSSWPALAAALYLAVVSTSLAYAIWGRLLRSYSAATVAPFPLLVPFVAAIGSSVVFGERFGPFRMAGMVSVLAGLAVVALPPRRRWPPGLGRPAASRQRDDRP